MRQLVEDEYALCAATTGQEMIVLSAMTLAILPISGRRKIVDMLLEARKNKAVVASDPKLRVEGFAKVGGFLSKGHLCAQLSAQRQRATGSMLASLRGFPPRCHPMKAQTSHPRLRVL